MDTKYQIRDIWNFFHYFYSAYPIRSILMVVTMTAAALAEGLGIASFLPLINVAFDSENDKSAFGIQVEHAIEMAGLELSIGTLLAIIVIAIIMKSTLLLVAMAQVGYSAAHVAMNLRLELVRVLLRARWQHFVKQRPGELASAVGSESVRAANAYVASCRAFAVGLQALVYLTISFAVSWQISIAAIAVGWLGVVALKRFVTISNRAGLEQTTFQKSFMTRFLQSLDGMKTLKAMGREENFGPLMEADVQGLNHAHRTIVISLEAVAELPEIIRVVAVAGGLYLFLTIWIHPIDSLLVLAFLFARTVQKISFIQNVYQIVAMDLPAFGFLRSTIAEAGRVQEIFSGGVVPHFGSCIELKAVSFSYGNKKVLDRVSMIFPIGKFVSIVGVSGVGKTTVADLVTGLLRPQEGEIHVDGVPMGDIDISVWRKMIGYVPQETFIFHDTIAFNVTLGDSALSSDRVSKALRRAGAWDFVAAMPEGMETMVGERGMRLSGGQRQRIAIARALIRDPAVLILDEATTALDPEMEAEIVATVRRLAGGVTVLAISHQEAIRRVADVVYAVSDGRVTCLEA